MHDFDEPVLMTISLFPSWFGEPQSNWRQSGHCVGFPFLDKPDADLTDELRRFIDLYGAPVVFSCGTGIQDVSHALNSAKWFCIKTKCPVIFLSKYASLDMGALPDAFRVYSHLDHKSLLPLAALVAHNGGMGTTAQALRAGVAQIVNPRVYDQPDTLSE